MSAFIDRAATDRLSLPCVCEGAPHGEDEIVIRSEYGYGDLTDIQSRSIRLIPNADASGVVAVTDPESEHYALLQTAIVSWTFVADDGSPIEVTLDNIRALREDIGNLVAVRANALYLAAKKRATLPNPSSGPSAPSSPAKVPASPNRSQRRAAKRSTPRSSSALAGPTLI